MGANIAGIYGAQIFRADDRPFYRRGFSIAIAVLAVGLTLAIVRYVDEFLRRRRGTVVVASEEGDSAGELDEKAPRPSDVQPPPILISSGHKPVVSGAIP